MTLFPPFSFPKNENIEDLIEHLEDDLESHLFGLDQAGHLNFERIDFNIGHKGILYLRPTLGPDFHHTLDILHNNLVKFHVRFKNQWKMKQKGHWDSETFLPLGRFGSGPYENEAMKEAYESARLEFALPLSLQASHVCLFENLTDQWVIKRKLFTFTHDDDNLRLDDISFQKPSEILHSRPS